MAEKISVIISLKDKASKGVASLTAKLTNLAKKGLIGATVGFGALSLILKKASGLAQIQEDAINNLNASMKNAGIYSEEASLKAQNFASSLQRVTIFGDEAILSAQSLLVSLGGLSGEGLEKATVATADLSAKLKIDLNTAAQLIGKSIGSSTNALARYGVEVEGSAGSTERLNSLVENSAKLFGGSAKAQAETFSGSVAQLNNSWGDLLETVGAVLNKALIPLLSTLSKGINYFNDLSPAIKKVVSVIVIFTTGVLGLTVAFGALATAINLATFGVPLIIAGITTSVALLGVGVNALVNKFGGWALLFSKIKKTSLLVLEELLFKTKEVALKITNILGKNNKKLEKLRKEHSKKIEKIENDFLKKKIQIEESKLKNKKDTDEQILNSAKETNEEEKKLILDKQLAEEKAREEKVLADNLAREEEKKLKKETNDKTLENFKDWREKIEAERDLDLESQIKWLSSSLTNFSGTAKEKLAVESELYKLKKDLRIKEEEIEKKSKEKLTNSILGSAQMAADGEKDILKASGNFFKDMLKKQIQQVVIARQLELAAFAAANFWNPVGWAAAIGVVGLEVLKNEAFAAIDRFEDGGIVSGSSFTGDKKVARVNSGELILNGSQQQNLAKQLFATANGSGGAGSNNAMLRKLDNIERAIMQPKSMKLDGNSFAKATYQVQKKMLRTGQLSSKG